MFGPNVGVAKWEDMKFFQEMEKKTNIAFKFNTPPNTSGRIVSVLTIARDITAKWQADIERENLESQLRGKRAKDGRARKPGGRDRA